MEGWRVRAARPDDLLALKDLARELSDFQDRWRVFAPRAGVDHELGKRYEMSLDDPDSCLVVAEGTSGTLLGMAMGHVHVPSSMSDDLAVEVAGVVVRASHRGQGIGRALALEVARFAERRGVSKLTLRTFAGNEQALAFWIRVGFEPRLVQLTADAARVAHPGPDLPAPAPG